MNNSDKPIAPVIINTGTNTHVHKVHFAGLTKREHFAAMAMQGSMAGDHEGIVMPKDHATFAVQCADALLEALDK